MQMKTRQQYSKQNNNAYSKHRCLHQAQKDDQVNATVQGAHQGPWNFESATNLTRYGVVLYFSLVDLQKSSITDYSRDLYTAVGTSRYVGGYI